MQPKVLIQNTFAYLDSTGKVEITPNMINKGSSDNCNAVNLSVNPKFLTCKNKGSNKVILTATDANGNSSTGLAIVNVIDFEPPKITCPPDITVNTKPNQCTVMSNLISLGSPSGITDNCAIKYPVTKNSVSIYPVGVTNIYWTISDSSLNTTTCIQKVTVLAATCGAPVKVINSDSTSTTAKIKWQIATCATDYEVNYREELTPGVWGSWSTWVSASGPGLMHQFIGLKSNKYYNYQIRTKCGTTVSAVVIGYIHTKAGANSGELQNRNYNLDDSDKSNVMPTNIEIIPNPASDNTTILIQGFESHSKEVIMLDLNGKQVFKINVDAKDNQLELDLKTLNVHTGVYLIRVSYNKKQKTEQLVIER